MDLDRFSHPLAFEEHRKEIVYCENCDEILADLVVSVDGDKYCSYECLHDDLGVDVFHV